MSELSQVGVTRPAGWRRHALWILPAVLVALIYGQVHAHSYVEYDDNFYTYGNPYVKQGLTWEGIRWAWSRFYISNYHPLTWMSHMLDFELFGGRPGLAAIENAVLHGLNAILVAFVFARLFGARAYGLAAGVIFASHPSLVEAVAWISQRKTLLATTFGLSATLSYLRATSSREAGTHRGWLLLSLALYVCSLLAKGMFVTLPAVLALLEFIRDEQSGNDQPLRVRLKGAVLRLSPYLLLAIACSMVTVAAQRADGALVELEQLAVRDRVATAAHGYVRYLVHAFAPFDLAAHYPRFPRSSFQLWSDVVLLGVITAVAFALRRYAGYSVFWGWLLFLGMLLPVIGLVQVGRQAMADRYLYPPILGLVVVVLTLARRLHRGDWAGASLAARLSPVVLGAWAFAMCAVAHGQAGLWSDTYTLVSDHNRRKGDSTLFLCIESRSLLQQGRFAEALAKTRQAYALNPGDRALWCNIAVMEMMAGNLPRAEQLMRQLVAATPRVAANHVYFGVVMRQGGHWDEVRSALARIDELEQRRVSLSTTEQQVVRELKDGLAERDRRGAP